MHTQMEFQRTIEMQKMQNTGTGTSTGTYCKVHWHCLLTQISTLVHPSRSPIGKWGSKPDNWPNKVSFPVFHSPQKMNHSVRNASEKAKNYAKWYSLITTQNDSKFLGPSVAQRSGGLSHLTLRRAPRCNIFVTWQNVTHATIMA